MITKPRILLIAVPLMTASSFAFSSGLSPLSTAVNDVRNGDLAYLASRALARLPQTVLENAPQSALTNTALKIKNNKGRPHFCF